MTIKIKYFGFFSLFTLFTESSIYQMMSETILGNNVSNNRADVTINTKDLYKNSCEET